MNNPYQIESILHRALALCLFVSVFSYASAQHASMGTNISNALDVDQHMTAIVTDGSENYFQIQANHLPATVYYWPDTAFGPIPMLVEVKAVDDTLSAKMVSEGCHMGWKWELAEAAEEENVRYFYFSTHENNAIAEFFPHTCDVTTSDTTAVACDSLLWKGEWRYATGDYDYQTTNAAGCDSIVTLHLTINHPTSGEVTLEECDSILWNGEWRKESGDYEYHTTNAAGCDSTAILHLTIHHAVSVTLNDTAVCETDFGYEYIWTDPIKDTVIHEAGTYTRRFKTAFGCDSVVTQTVRFLNMTYGEGIVTAYDKYITTMGFPYTVSTQGAVDYFTNAAGCDSVVTMDLYIRHLQVIDTFPQTVCETELPFEWYGKSYMDGGLHTTDTILGKAVNGVYMDTVHTVNLTILPVSAGDTAATACESFEWYGQTYEQSGDYDHTLEGRNIHGCDSVLTLHLTIYHATTGDTTASACESFEWYGTTYTESAEPKHTFTNSHGCDSVVTLHLTIYHATTGDTTATACESFEWYGQTYEQSGEYDHTFVGGNSHGCDSTVTLHLTIYHATAGEESRTEINSYVWHGTTYTESGDYTYETKNSHGCDSTATLHLTIVDREYMYDTVYFCQGFNTEHEELISETTIRRYRMYVYESPAEWDYQEGLLLSQQDRRVELDLRHVEQSLEAHYIGELEPVKQIQWTFVKKGETAIETLQSTAEPVWKDFGRLTIEVRFTCGHIFSETIPVGSTEDFENIDAESNSVRKVLKDGRIYILRGNTKYTIEGLVIKD